jgi:futalosine hydrolase
MDLLIVAATQGEMRPIPLSPFRRAFNPNVLITGVGMVATTYALTKHFQSNEYDLVLQVGVAGSYDTNLKLGDLVFVTSDQYGDFGAEDHDQYLDIFDMGLLDKNADPFTDGRLFTTLLPVHNHIKLPQVCGLTVNTVSGKESTIERRRNMFKCAVESMEGAAFHEVCMRENVPFAQVRAVSNYVTLRDKSQWRMKEAIDNLNQWLVNFIDGK